MLHLRSRVESALRVQQHGRKNVDESEEYGILSRCATHAGLWMLVLAMSGHIGIAAAERLQDAVQTALRRNPEVLGAAANLRAANQGYTAAGGGRLPTVDLRIGSGREETESLATRTATGTTRTLNRRKPG